MIKPTNQQIVAERSFAAGAASRDAEIESLRKQLADTEEKRADLEFVWNGCEQELENCKAERDQLRQQLA